jgi:hypothetical protein
MRAVVATAALVLLQQSGCDTTSPKPASVNKTAAKVAKPRRPIHRFVLTKYPENSGVAFDTQTGQICRTWDWQPVGREAVTDENGRLTQRSIGEFAPTCDTLYQKFSSSSDSAVSEDDGISQ